MGMMKSLVALVAVLVGLVGMHPAISYGVTWESYAVLGNDKVSVAKYFVGLPVEVINNDTFRIWYKLEIDFPAIALSIITEYLEIDCKKRTKTLLQKTVIDGADKPVVRSDYTDVN